MGGSKKQIVGYKYFLGMHLVFGQGPMDALLELKFGERTAWKGSSTGGRITFDKQELYGSQKEEGGVSGAIDVEMGRPDQIRNDYLQSVLGLAIPAYRGVAALVLRQPYLGNNPYIKAISAKWTNCRSLFGDWYPEKCVISQSYEARGAAIYIAMDLSGSMAGAKQVAQKAAVSDFLETLRGTENMVKVVTYSDAVVGSIERFDCTDASIDALQAFVAAIDEASTGGTNFGAGVSLAAQFYTDADASETNLALEFFAASFGFQNAVGTSTEEAMRRVLLFLTDGLPSPTSTATTAVSTIAGIEAVEVFAINIQLTDTTYTEMLDNTPQDGVPVIAGGDSSALQAAISAAFLTWQDVNPAHILRDAILDPGSGGTGDESEIGDTFASAADTLFDEGFGLSLYWENGLARADFQQLVERHIDGNLFVDRQTGKWEIKLNRDDYDAGLLPVFDAPNIQSWQDLSRPQSAELPNYVTLTYTRREDGEPSTMSLANLGALQAAGRIRSEPVKYEGITDPALASKVLLRDTIAVTTPRWTGACTVAYLDPALNRGSVVKINEPRLGLNNVVVRLTEIEESDGTDDSALIRFAEDTFALPGDAIVAPDDVTTADARDALPGGTQLVEEAPYYLGVLQQGQVDLDADLAAEPDLGYFHATEDRPNGFHINANVTVDAGAGWFNVALTDYAPTVDLLTGLTDHADDVTCEIGNSVALGEVAPGSLCAINGEFLRVDNLVVNGSTVTATLGRGCLDTLPAEHLAGAKVIFFQDFANTDGAQYLAGEAIDVKLRGRTNLDEVKIGEAPNTNIVFDSRAIRPYPPGDFKLNGAYGFTHRGLTGTDTFTWSHRDRTLQTTLAVEDYTAGNIGPEPGTTYRFKAEAFDFDDVSLGVMVDVSGITGNSYLLGDYSGMPAGIDYFKITVTSARAGYDCRAPVVMIAGPAWLFGYGLSYGRNYGGV